MDSASPALFEGQPLTPAARLARNGTLAAERGDCVVVVKIRDELATMNVPAVLDKFLHDVGVAACLP